MKTIRDYIRNKTMGRKGHAVLAGLLALIIILGWAMCGTGCASPPAPETVRAPAEIHAEGLPYGDNIRDWPLALAYEFRQSHYAYVIHAGKR